MNGRWFHFCCKFAKTSFMGMFEEIFEFLDDLVIAIIMIVMTSLIHAFGLDRIMGIVTARASLAQGSRPKHHFHKIMLGTFCILGIFLLVTIHIWLWAFAYRILDVREFRTLEDAVYFSTVTFTTLGYGDIVLHDEWRVLSGIEAANGIVLLGWGTAFLFEIMQMLYPRKKS